MALTPYDTGKRAEPHIWSITDPGAEPGSVIWGIDQDRYGRVDFDDDGGETLVTVWVEKNELGEHVVHIQQLSTEASVRIHA